MRIKECGKIMHDKGYVYGTAGNISYKGDGSGGIDITRTGVHLGFIDYNGILYVDENGELLAVPCGGAKPTSELPTHINVYKERHDVKAIIHTHLVNVLVADEMDSRWFEGVSTELSDYYLDLRLDSTEEYHESGSDEGMKAVVALAKNHDAIIAKDHGVWVFGKDLFEAFIRLEALYELSEMYIKLKLLKKGI